MCILLFLFLLCSIVALLPSAPIFLFSFSLTHTTIPISSVHLLEVVYLLFNVTLDPPLA